MLRSLHALSVHVPRRCVPRGSSHGCSKTRTMHRTTAAPLRPNGREHLSRADLSRPAPINRPLRKWGELVLVKRSALRAGSRAPPPTAQTLALTLLLPHESPPLSPART